jgi:SAM-dependent methyltransferase
VTDFQTLFALAMKRHLPPLAHREGRALDLGATGRFVAPGAEPLGRPAWVWPRDAIPAADESVAVVHAYHFLEHLAGREAVTLVREVERVLVPGGVFNYSVPYYNTTLQAQDLEHRSMWCEDTFRNLFEDFTYEHASGRAWRLGVHFQVIVGLVQRNLALVGQLVKDAPAVERPTWCHPGEVNNEVG